MLIMSRNLLAALPAEVLGLKALRRLELADNHLTALPVEVTQLPHLEVLLLQNNCLKALPIETGYMVQLKTLNLDANPLSGRASGGASETFLEVWVSGRSPSPTPESTPADLACSPAVAQPLLRTSSQASAACMGGSLAERTQSVLHYLQDHMSSEELEVLHERQSRCGTAASQAAFFVTAHRGPIPPARTIARRPRLELDSCGYPACRWHSRQARQQLKSALRVANMDVLQRALNLAEAARLTLDDTEMAREAMRELHCMRSAAQKRCLEELMAAIVGWEKVRARTQRCRPSAAKHSHHLCRGPH